MAGEMQSDGFPVGNTMIDLGDYEGRTSVLPKSKNETTGNDLPVDTGHGGTKVTFSDCKITVRRQGSNYPQEFACKYESNKGASKAEFTFTREP